MIRALRSQVQGLVRTARLGHASARALAVGDSRALVRSLFLASATQADLLPRLQSGLLFSEIVDETRCTRPERLRAWLDVGSELGELGRRGDRYHVEGRRARAIADGDPVLSAHYRSMLDYQTGPYATLEALLRSDTGDGRADLTRCADDIARVSLAAAPFVASFIEAVVQEMRPARVLDVGCGTGIYSNAVLSSDPRVTVLGIDLADAVVERAREDFRSRGLGARIDLRTGDVRAWAHESSAEFELILLLNNVYYFDPSERSRLFRELGRHLSQEGQLIVASMTTPGSIAAAHLHFMLACQSGAVSLPHREELAEDLRSAGYSVLETRALVPTEPFLAVRAARAPGTFTPGHSPRQP